MSTNVSQQSTQQEPLTTPTSSSGPTVEETYMRKISLHFVIALCTFSQIASLIAFFHSNNVEAAVIFELPSLFFFYKILNYLFPSNDKSINPIIALIQLFIKAKVPNQIK